MNIPLRFVEAAALRCFADGTGDIALTLPRGRADRIPDYVAASAAERITHPQPSLRALIDAKQAAGILSAALEAH